MKKNVRTKQSVVRPKGGQKPKSAARRRDQYPLGYVIETSHAWVGWQIVIPFTEDCIDSAEGEFPPDQFAQIAHAAGRAGLSIAQFLNRVHRDYFARCDCGDKQSPRTCRVLPDCAQ